MRCPILLVRTSNKPGHRTTEPTALTAFRKPFVPPTKDTPLVMRSISYGGEEHPATVKRVIVTPVAHLPLKDNAARHNLKLIAGSRWTPHPPRDSGIGTGEDGSEHGYVKVSCEDFPRPAMNLKWASDLIDRLVVEANVRDFLQSPAIQLHTFSFTECQRNYEGHPDRYATRRF